MEAVSPDRPVLRFGNFEADLASGELRKNGIRIHVQEQPFKVLSALVERPGQVISREELVRRLWPDGTFVDYDRGLNAAINRLRQVLTDSAENPRYVETVAGHGYRFIAPVEITRTDAAERCDWQRSAVPPRSSRGRTFWSAGAVALVALVAGMFLLRRDLNPPALSFEPVPMTSYEGSERQPSFSPDGTQLAFSWDDLDRVITTSTSRLLDPVRHCA